MNTCLYCGLVDKCKKITNKPADCENFMKKMSVDALEKIGHCSLRDFRAGTKCFYIQVYLKFKSRGIFNDYEFRLKGGELYARPKKKEVKNDK